MIKLLRKIKKEFLILTYPVKLKYIHKINFIGKNVRLEKGFKVTNGSNNIIIGNNVSLNDVVLNAGDTEEGKIIIKDNVFFGHKCMVLARSHDYLKYNSKRQTTITEKKIVIENGVWITSGVIILNGLRIGKNSVIAAGAIVTKDVLPYCVYGGVPAKLIKSLR